MSDNPMDVVWKAWETNGKVSDIPFQSRMAGVRKPRTQLHAFPADTETGRPVCRCSGVKKIDEMFDSSYKGKCSNCEKQLYRSQARAAADAANPDNAEVWSASNRNGYWVRIPPGHAGVVERIKSRVPANLRMWNSRMVAWWIDDTFIADVEEILDEHFKDFDPPNRSDSGYWWQQ